MQLSKAIAAGASAAAPRVPSACCSSAPTIRQGSRCSRSIARCAASHRSAAAASRSLLCTAAAGAAAATARQSAHCSKTTSAAAPSFPSLWVGFCAFASSGRSACATAPAVEIKSSSSSLPPGISTYPRPAAMRESQSWGVGTASRPPCRRRRPTRTTSAARSRLSQHLSRRLCSLRRCF